MIMKHLQNSVYQKKIQQIHKLKTNFTAFQLMYSLKISLSRVLKFFYNKTVKGFDIIIKKNSFEVHIVSFVYVLVFNAGVGKIL